MHCQGGYNEFFEKKEQIFSKFQEADTLKIIIKKGIYLFATQKDKCQ